MYCLWRVGERPSDYVVNYINISDRIQRFHEALTYCGGGDINLGACALTVHRHTRESGDYNLHELGTTYLLSAAEATVLDMKPSCRSGRGKVFFFSRGEERREEEKRKKGTYCGRDYY